MKCPECKSKKTKVTDSRIDGMKRYRMRECKDCDYAFITYEVVPEELKPQAEASRFVEDDFDLPF